MPFLFGLWIRQRNTKSICRDRQDKRMENKEDKTREAIREILIVGGISEKEVQAVELVACTYAIEIEEACNIVRNIVQNLTETLQEAMEALSNAISNIADCIEGICDSYKDTEYEDLARQQLRELEICSSSKYANKGETIKIRSPPR